MTSNNTIIIMVMVAQQVARTAHKIKAVIKKPTHCFNFKAVTASTIQNHLVGMFKLMV